MAPTISEQFGMRLLEPAIDWLPNLAEKYRQRSIFITTLGEARQLTYSAFIKPPNDKSFPAKVYQPGDLPPDYPDNTKVLIAEIVEWEKEFRCFIFDRTLQTFSVYLRDGKLQRDADFANSLAEEREVRDFISIILADSQIELPRSTVIDIGIIQGKGWAIVEQNSAWGAGIYGCDPSAVLEVLRYAAIAI
jgi:ATP-grasp domain, R2K clade family 2